ncbi:MAG: YcdB/YcdC domain-containing protein, partial [Brevibacillus sp.]
MRKQDAAGVETALDRLRKRAMSLFNIPSSYRLMIEDGERHKKGNATFLWVKPDSEEGIAVTFSSEGKLLEFTQD